MEPRVWDLLIFLIENRNRVVSKSELLENIWHTSSVSDSVVTRAVMKARQAIGDDTDDPRLIKTLHRLGYRFIGVLDAPVPLSQASSPGPDPRITDDPLARPLVLAMLPIQDETGDPMLAWVELGLLVLAAKELEAGRRVRVVPVADLLHALRPLAPDTPLPKLADHLSDNLHAELTLRAVLSRNGASYTLQWSLIGNGGLRTGEAWGTVPTALTIEVVRQVLATLFDPGREQDALDADADFINEAFARAMVAKANYSFKEAHALFAICTQPDDCPLEFRCEFAMVLANFDDPATPSCANKIIEGAGKTGDAHAEGIAHTALAFFHLFDGDFEAAERAGDRALELLSVSKSPGERAHALATRAMVAIRAYEFNYARRLLAEALEVGESIKGIWVQSWAPSQSAIIEEFEGNIDVAVELYQHSIDAARSTGNLINEAFGLCYMGHLNAGQGRIAEGQSQIEQSLELAKRFGSGRAQIIIHLTLTVLHLRQGKMSEAYASRAALADAQLLPVHLRRGALAHCDALIELTKGDTRLALDHFVIAAEQLGGHQRFWRDSGVVMYAHAALLAGEHGIAEQNLQALEEHHAFDRNRPKRTAALLLRAVMLYSAGKAHAAEEKLRAAKSLGVMNELGGLIAFALAWIALDRKDLEAYQAERIGLGDWVDSTPAGALLEARYAVLSADAVALDRIRSRLASRGWSNTRWGSAAALLCSDQKATGSAGRPPGVHLPLPV